MTYNEGVFVFDSVWTFLLAVGLASTVGALVGLSLGYLTRNVR